MTRIILLILLHCYASGSYSEIPHSVKSIKIPTPTTVSIDRKGNIYLATFNGDIIRYNSQLANEEIFSPQDPNVTDILEAWQGLRIFTFHRELQEFRLINRNLSLNENYNFPLDMIGFAELATPTFDNNVWVIDQTDFSLKKYNITSKSLENTTPLGLILNPADYELLHAREYQNRLFVSTKNQGILIFDNFGNFIESYNDKGIDYFNFWGDAIYFIKNKELRLIDLYSQDTKRIDLPKIDEPIRFVLKFNEKLYFFTQSRLYLYAQKNPE